MDEGCTPVPRLVARRNGCAGSGPTRPVVPTERAGFAGGREALVKVVVDLTRCQGYAQCAFAAPDVFTIRGDEALLYDPAPDDAQRAKIVRAAAMCPVQAITLERSSRLGRDDVRQPPEAVARAAAESSEEAFKRTGRIVIVGASLAGLRAGLVLRREGFTGSLTVIGDEPYPPYDRPPLSKQVLIGPASARETALALPHEIAADRRTAVAAPRLAVGAKQVRPARRRG